MTQVAAGCNCRTEVLLALAVAAVCVEREVGQSGIRPSSIVAVGVEREAGQSAICPSSIVAVEAEICPSSIVAVEAGICPSSIVAVGAEREVNQWVILLQKPIESSYH